MANENGYITVTAENLRDFAAAILEKGGFLQAEAQKIAASLVQADLMGYESHGVNRVPGYLKFLKDGAVVSGVDIKILNETPAIIHCDAQSGAGQVQMPRLLDRLIPKARDCGVTSASMKHCGHIGRLGEWAQYLSQAGLAGMVMVNDNGAYYIVAPPGTKDARISTNPVAFGIPLKPDPFVLDISTSSVAVGKIAVAYVSGKLAPEGVLQDAEGRPTRDPIVALKDPKGAILPMGGHKGFGLGMIVDFLSAGMSGGFCPPAEEGAQEQNNVFVTAWDPEKFAGLEHLRREAERLVSFIREARPVNANNDVRLPGDQSGKTARERTQNGIPLAAGIAARLNREAEKLGLNIPDIFQ